MQQHFNRLIQSVAEQLGQQVEAGEEETRISFEFEDGPVLVEHLRDARQLLMAMPLADLPEENRAALMLALLQGQYFFHQTAGATLAVDPEASFISLAVIKDMETLTPENFPDLMENFLRVADFWRGEIEKFGEGRMEASAEEALPNPVTFAGGMMRV
jgi:hypothetical protein